MDRVPVPSARRAGLTPREWFLIALVAAVALALWWRVREPPPPAETQLNQAAISRLMRLPRPVPLEGAHPVRPLPYSPGRVEGISPDQDLLHHQRRYVDFVNRWNLAEEALGQAQASGEFVWLLSDVPPMAHAVTLHELFWRQLAPGGEPGQAPSSLVQAILAFPFERAESCFPSGDGWFLIVWDIAEARLRPAGLEERGAHGAWACVPVVAIDLYHHARAVDFHRDRTGFFAQIWENLNPARVDERLGWLYALHGAAGGEATEMELSPGPLTADEIVRSNASAIERVAFALRDAETASELGSVDIFGGRLGEETLTRWLAWTPGWAVLAWEPHSGEPLLLGVDTPGAGTVWGAIPLLALARAERPTDLEAAQAALSRLPWREINDRVAALRAAGAGAELD